MYGMQEILFVDSDEPRTLSVDEALVRAGYAVERHASGAAAMRRLVKTMADLVVLDMRLPDVAGLEVLAWIKVRFPELPVVVLGSAAFEHDAVVALRAGADDFVRKPVAVDEFVARIASLLRRRHRPVRDVMELGHLVIDMRMQEVTVAGDWVRLTPIEYQIVELLASEIGTVISRETIASRVWGRALDEAVSRSLDTHIYRIRRKLRLHKSTGLILRSVYTAGYKFEHVSDERSASIRRAIADRLASPPAG
ncbi:response regulator transcription factor [Burkholderia sp. AW33-5]